MILKFLALPKERRNMKIGEIKLQSIALMYPEYKLVYTPDDASITSTLEALSLDPSFSDYLSSMVGAINRALVCFEIKGLTKAKEIKISTSECEAVSFNRVKIPLDKKEVLYVESVFDSCGTSLDFEDTQELFVQRGTFKGYTIKYKERLPKISHVTGNNFVIPLNEELLMLIPYFVKGELLRGESPSEAEASRKEFEGLLCEYEKRCAREQKEVYSIYFQE